MPAAAEAKLEGSGKGIVAAKELLACRGITTQGCYCDVFIPRYAIPRGNKDGAGKKRIMIPHTAQTKNTGRGNSR